MKKSAITILLLSIALTAAATTTKPPSPKAAPPDTKPSLDASLLKGMAWREVGPYRGGRADSVEGIVGDRNTYYFGSCGGGVWKSTDGGQTWKAVSDGFFGGSIGAVAVAPSDPAVVYAGTGEETVRGNVSSGDGMWKSTDAGKSWTKIGLEDTRHIGRIRVHPKDPNLVYVAAMGHAFGPNETRGVYRSKDGGKSWERVLFVNRDAGAVDLDLDPTNPRIIYASTWRYRRTPWSFDSGGDGCALWKSADGGDTWKELSKNKGMPKGTLGIIGVSVSATNAQNVYAIVEAKDGGVYRSHDAGETWTKVSGESDLKQRAWYYTRIYADPKDEDTAYVVNVRFHKTKDVDDVSCPHRRDGYQARSRLLRPSRGVVRGGRRRRGLPRWHGAFWALTPVMPSGMRCSSTARLRRQRLPERIFAASSATGRRLADNVRAWAVRGTTGVGVGSAAASRLRTPFQLSAGDDTSGARSGRRHDPCAVGLLPDGRAPDGVSRAIFVSLRRLPQRVCRGPSPHQCPPGVGGGASLIEPPKNRRDAQVRPPSVPEPARVACSSPMCLVPVARPAIRPDLPMTSRKARVEGRTCSQRRRGQRRDRSRSFWGYQASASRRQSIRGHILDDADKRRGLDANPTRTRPRHLDAPFSGRVIASACDNKPHRAPGIHR